MATTELTQPSLQYVLPPKHVVYVGAVGDDQLADQLRAANDKVRPHRLFDPRKSACS
jgi:hypothetical protein